MYSADNLKTLPQSQVQPYRNARASTRNRAHPNDMEIRQLPHSIQALIRVLGLNATAQMLKRFGGRSIYIPKQWRKTCTLQNVLNEDDLRQLIKAYGGESIDLPKVDTIERHQRNLAIAAASAAGVSRAKLVADYGLSRRQIGNIRRQYRTVIESLSGNQT